MKHREVESMKKKMEKKNCRLSGTGQWPSHEVEDSGNESKEARCAARERSRDDRIYGTRRYST